MDNPLGNDPHGSEMIEHLLHQANLLRLRGDFDAAERTCAMVLENHPGQPDALALLGDIKFEWGDFDDAAHWYGLALAESPDRPGLREKLARAQEIIRTREADAGAAQIGLSGQRWPAWIIPALVVVAAVAIGGAAFLAGTKNAPPTVYREPISIPSPTPINPTPETPLNPQPVAETTPKAEGVDPQNIPSGTSRVASSDTPPRFMVIPNLKSVSDDPRTSSTTFSILRANSNVGQPAPAEAAQAVASDIFRRFTDMARITIRFVDPEGQTLYIADFASAEPTKPMNEWPPNQSSQTTPGTNPVETTASENPTG